MRLARRLRWGGVLVLLAGSAHGQTFAPQGPAPIAGAPGQRSALAIVSNGSLVSGAVGPVVASPVDASRLWLGGINGGVWTTTNGGASWKALTDGFPSLSIGALSLDPSSNPAAPTLVAGFGNFSNAAGIGGPQAGLICPTMAGRTGARSRDVPGGVNISGVAVNGQTIIAGGDAGSTNGGGLFVSNTGGRSFSAAAGVTGAVTSLAPDPSNPARFYAATAPFRAGQNSAVYVTNNGGAELDADVHGGGFRGGRELPDVDPEGRGGAGRVGGGGGCERGLADLAIDRGGGGCSFIVQGRHVVIVDAAVRVEESRCRRRAASESTAAARPRRTSRWRSARRTRTWCTVSGTRRGWHAAGEQDQPTPPNQPPNGLGRPGTMRRSSG